MAKVWTVDELKALPSQKVLVLYRNARGLSDPAALALVDMIVENGLLIEPDGGLPWDHPIMLEIEEICGLQEAVSEAVAASEQGLPALAGMEHRIVASLGNKYGTNYTTNHAGRCIANAMIARGWKQSVQRSMPNGSVAKSATIFVRKEC